MDLLQLRPWHRLLQQLAQPWAEGDLLTFPLLSLALAGFRVILNLLISNKEVSVASSLLFPSIPSGLSEIFLVPDCILRNLRVCPQLPWLSR